MDLCTLSAANFYLGEDGAWVFCVTSAINRLRLFDLPVTNNCSMQTLQLKRFDSQTLCHLPPIRGPHMVELQCTMDTTVHYCSAPPTYLGPGTLWTWSELLILDGTPSVHSSWGWRDGGFQWRLIYVSEHCLLTDSLFLITRIHITFRPCCSTLWDS